MDFMKAYIDAHPDKDDPPEFAAPGNIVFLAVDKGNGAPSEAAGSLHEAFIAGTQPGANTLTRQPEPNHEASKNTKDTRRRKPIWFSSCCFFVPFVFSWLS